MKKFVLLFLVISLSASLAAEGNELTMILPSQSIELDPQKAFNTTEAQLFTGIYEGLVSYDPQTLRPLPAAAESWSLSPDRKTYTFKLRPGLRFSDGTRLSAQSFYRSFLRLLDPKDPKQNAQAFDVVVGAKEFRYGKATEQQLGFKAIDETTLEITLNHPTPYFISILAHYSFSPISQGQLPGSWNNPMKIAYSGPFIIKEVTKDSMQLVPNPFYWDKEHVRLSSIRLQFKSDPQTVSKDFNHYKADWALSGAFDPNLITLKNTLRVGPQFSSTYYFFSSSNKAFKNQLVRLALVQALPLTQMRKTQLIKAQSLVPPIANYPQNKGITENMEEAAKTLKKAGHAGGKGLPPVTIAALYEEDPNALIMKQSWEKLGLRVSIIVPPEEDYFDYIEENHPTIAMMSWVGDYLDPFAFLDMWRSKNPLNASVFKDKAFDDLLNASNLQRGKERFKTLSDAEALLLDSGIIIPIGHAPSINLIDLNSIDGWYDNPLNIHPFKYIGFKKAGGGAIIVT